MRVIKKTLMTCGLTMLLSSAMLTTKSLATETKDFTKYPNDVTAPWGRVSVESGTAFNNITYVEDRNITVKIYAADDKCAQDEIQFALSFSSLTGTTITDWNKLADGNEVQLTLPDATNAHQIYAAFKDYNGNISIVSTVTNQTVTYNLNGGSYNGSTANLTGVDSTRYYGAPFVITEKMPSKDGVSFIGWSTDPAATEASYHAGQIILPEMVIGSSTDATLYAVYTTEAQGYLKLSDVVDVGDFVNYPVDYTNVATFDNSYIAELNGWRVLSVSGDEVNLVSAGMPMSYCHGSDSSTSISNLAIKFLETPFTSVRYGYKLNGFDPSKTLTEVFTNKYTATYETYTEVSYPGYNTTLTGTKTAGTPKVRAMTKEDVDKIYDPTGATKTKDETQINDSKYNELLAIGAAHSYAYQCFASAYNENSLWTSSIGKMSYNYYNNLTNYVAEYGVRPVVTLKADVLVTGKDAIGAWNITIEEEKVELEKILADVVEVGDYVNYSVEYENVPSYNGNYPAILNGWRVLSKDVDIDGNKSIGTVNLISAGIPMTYYHNSNANTSVTNLTINFLQTPINTSGVGYRLNGFDQSKTLTEVFTNDYTATYETDTVVSYPGYNTTLTGTKTAGTPKVRAMTKEDLDKIYDPTGATIAEKDVYITNEKYKDMLAVPSESNYTYTRFASVYNASYLWHVGYDGRMNINNTAERGIRIVISLKPNIISNGTDTNGAWNITLGE